MESLFLFIPLLLLLHGSAAHLLYGCIYEPSLCDPEETCTQDGMFGRCQRAPYEKVNYNDLGDVELELLRLELMRLVKLGLKWHSAETQCVISYFFLTRKENIRFDPDFCNVREPANILDLIQVAEKTATRLAAAGEVERVVEALEGDGPDYEQEDYNPNDYDYPSPDYIQVVPLGSVEVPDYSLEDDYDIAGVPSDSSQELSSEVSGEDAKNALLTNVVNELLSSMDQRDERSEFKGRSAEDVEELSERDVGGYALSQDEENKLNELLLEVINGGKPDLQTLTDDELNKFISYVELMQSLLDQKTDGQTEGEIIPEIPQKDSSDSEKFLLKKDEEEVGNLDNGLNSQEHKIVKGKGKLSPVEHSLGKIEGNRVYIQTNMDLTEDSAKSMELVNYLRDKIAKPKHLVFTNFKIEPKEISFDVKSEKGKEGEISEKWLNKVFSSASKRTISPEGLEAAAAIATNKRKMASLVGPDTQIMIGSPSKRSGAVVEKGEDGIVLPTLVVCGLIVGVLVTLLGVYVFRNRSRARSTLKRLAADLEGQPTKAYEELCRQRMGGKEGGPEPLGTVINTFTHRLGSQSESPTGSGAGNVKGNSPRTSSTSSWSEEPVHITNMDISTGHMILNYLEEHLKKKDKLEEDWNALSLFKYDTNASTLVAQQNPEKNRTPDIVPYDEVRVRLQSEAGGSPHEYINASPLYDADPKNPVYIATQAPLVGTATEFWQMVWEQGCVVIVNLTKLVEDGQNACHRYWPENGSEVHGVFEVHLVSEHIWCEDYLVRSFYLKNLRTAETRTVTQFHFLSWRENGLPAAPKPILEFRRKVNKSYRGRSCPIVIHCSDGASRTGTYALLDMVLNRINKGVKEIDIAATLEHLREQRMGLVGTKDQYEFVLSCVAEEVTAIIKALPH